MDNIALIVTIVASAVGATWVLSAQLSSIQSAITALVMRVDQHDAKIISLERRRNGRNR